MTETKKKATKGRPSQKGVSKSRGTASSNTKEKVAKSQVSTQKTKKQNATAKTKQLEMPLKKEKSLLRYEVELILLFGLTVLSAVAIHTDLTGVFGRIMKSIYLGLFGFAGVTLTYVIFALVFFNINKFFADNKRRLSGAALCLFASVLLFSATVNLDVYMNAISSQGFTIGEASALKLSFDQGIIARGGGVLGNLLVIGMVNGIGKFGVYLLGTLFAAITLVLTFKVSLSGWIKSSGIATYKGLKPVAGKIKQMPDQLSQKRELHRIAKEKAVEHSKEQEEVASVIEEAKMPILAFDSDLYFENEMGELAEEPLLDALPEGAVSLNMETGEYQMDQDQSIVHYVAPELDREEEQLESQSEVFTHEFVFHSGVEELRLEEVEETKVMEIEAAEMHFEELEIDPEVPEEASAAEKVDAAPAISEAVKTVPKPLPKPYVKPPLSLLNPPKAKSLGNREEIADNVKTLETTMRSFGVDAKVTEVTKGPAITMYEVLPAPGVKVAKIVNLQDDIALALAAPQIRMIAPIPGKSAIGIEIPNKDTTMVTAREVFESDEFRRTDSKLSFALGKDITGKTIIADLAKMPHLLIAGSTGSGKSVCVNTIINSILFNATPEEVKLLMIDPKVVELSHYNGIPHLILPVVVDPKKASIALNWAVNEMTNRYKAFAENMVKDINTYNRKAETQPELNLEKMAKIVILVDELADLMMVAPNQVEDAICRLAQMARAAGIHLIVATQRPSVDVITGLIKANIPSRIAFAVSSQIDSRTILDMAGAEKLLGKGDMLFYPLGANKPVRVQGAFLADQEVEGVVGFVKQQTDGTVEYQEEILSDYVETAAASEADELLSDAIELVIDTGQASISMLQRKFRVGYNRAARLIDQMEERHIVGPSLGSKPREVLLTKIEWEQMKNA